MFSWVVRYNYEVGRQEPWQGCMLICIGLVPCGNMGEWFNCHGKTPGLYKDKNPPEVWLLYSPLHLTNEFKCPADSQQGMSTSLIIK